MDIKVLIIEDDPMVVDINRKVIQECPGFVVVGTARSGAEGLEAARRYQPNLVILDIFMPQVNGLQFLKHMRERGFDTDVIMVTASDDLLHLKECMRHGVVDYIVKPFRLSRLKAALENYLKMAYKLQGKHSMCQEDIDSVVMKSNTGGKLPKGLSDYTLKVVKQFFQERKQAYTADDVADSLGLARVTARRYLEHLAAAGDLEINLTYGSVGRPVKKYQDASRDHKDQNDR